MRLNQLLRHIYKWVEDRFLRVGRAAESLYKVLVSNRRWFAVTSAAAEDFWAKKMYYYSGNFTYNAFLAVVALVVAVTAVLGFLASNKSLNDQLLKELKGVVPLVGTAPKQTLSTLKTYSGVAGVIGIIALLWTGTKIFGAIEWGFCEIWGTKRRSYARKKVFGLALISIIGLLFLAAVLVQFGFSAAWGWLAGHSGAVHSIGIIVAKPLIGLAVAFILFLVVYRVVPTVKLSFRDIWAGALVAGAIFLGMQYLISFYFGSISNVPSVYGTLSTAIILIIWLHITGVILFFGGEVIFVMNDDALIEEHRARASSWSLFGEWQQGSSEQDHADEKDDHDLIDDPGV